MRGKGFAAGLALLCACHEAPPSVAVSSATMVVDSAPPPAPPVPRPSTSAGADAKTDGDLIVVARLVHRGFRAPDCGGAYISVVMRYEVLRVVQGEYRGTTLYAVVGCPELPRTNMGKDAGSLERFDVGAVHRLWLRDVPAPEGKLDIFGDPELPRLWTVRAEPEHR